jgi:hypothetical protein
LVAYDDKFNSKDFVCGTDGGISLINGLHKHRSDAYPIRDYRHLLLDITSPRARKVMAQIHDLPPSRKARKNSVMFTSHIMGTIMMWCLGCQALLKHSWGRGRRMKRMKLTPEAA